jgi:hypothetical protein
MDIKGKIRGIKYKVFLSEELPRYNMNRFNINKVTPCCIVFDKQHSFAVSKWVSPKRTRSYPYERVYNTLNISKKITVIPIVKDEGAAGDRDFIQWDTVSLMSLLNVYIIFAYYSKVDVAGGKITNQKFENKYVRSKIKEISQYHSSALHWNLNELQNNLHNMIAKTKKCYAKIEKQTGIPLHNLSGLDNFGIKIDKGLSSFMKFSRDKAQKAQLREIVTRQPKESLSTLSKAKITIINYLGGQYFFTTDEISINEETVYLIERKHSKNNILPSKSDIKDGLLKMILYSNLSEVTVNDRKMNSEAVLVLTSTKINGKISSKSSAREKSDFISNNHFLLAQSGLIDLLFREAEENNFTVQIVYAQ